MSCSQGREALKEKRKTQKSPGGATCDCPDVDFSLQRFSFLSAAGSQGLACQATRLGPQGQDLVHSQPRHPIYFF